MFSSWETRKKKTNIHSRRVLKASRVSEKKNIGKHTGSLLGGTNSKELQVRPGPTSRCLIHDYQLYTHSV